MSRIIILVFFFLCSFSPFLFGQSQPILKEDLEKDLAAYHDSILAYHVNPFTQISRGEFSEGLELLKKKSVSLNEDELLVELLKVNAKIGDEHTRIRTTRDPKFFQLECYWFEEGIYILRTDTEYSDAMLTKIIAVNDVPIIDVTIKLAALIPGNNAEIKKSVQDYLCYPEILHGLKIIDNIDCCVLTLVRQNGDTVKKKIESKTTQATKFSSLSIGERFLRNQSTDNYWYRYDSFTGSLYFQYRLCKEDPQKLFGKFRERLFAELESKQAKRLIIDLRYNTGGSSYLLNLFMEKLWKTSVRKNHEIFVLIGRRTFSSAVLNAFDLKEKDDAILVGEDTGGSVNHFGEVRQFKLPCTKLLVSCSTKYFLKDKSQTGSLKPDQVFSMKFSDFLNGIDPPLNYAQTH